MDMRDAAYRFVQDANCKEAKNCAVSGQNGWGSELAFAILALVCVALWFEAKSPYIAAVWGGIATIQVWRVYRAWRSGNDA